MPARKRTLAAVPARASAQPMPRADAWSWAAPALIGLAALLVYGNSLSNGFVWDDPIILTRQLTVFRTVGDVLVPPRDIPQFSPDYYRPLTIATYLLDRAAGGGAPFAFHLSVVLAHAATSVLVYLLALQLLGSSMPRQPVPLTAAARRRSSALAGAAAAGALFALHPIHTESVAWAAGRSDVLATGFMVATLLLQPRARRSWIASTAAGLCALAALGSKETAVALYPLMFLREVMGPLAERRDLRAWVRGYAGPLIAAAVYLLLRRNALGELDRLGTRRAAAGRALAARAGRCDRCVRRKAAVAGRPQRLHRSHRDRPVVRRARRAAGRRLRPGMPVLVEGCEGPRGRGFESGSGSLGASDPRTLEPWPAAVRADLVDPHAGPLAGHRVEDSRRAAGRALPVSAVGGVLSAGGRRGGARCGDGIRARPRRAGMRRGDRSTGRGGDHRPPQSGLARRPGAVD